MSPAPATTGSFADELYDRLRPFRDGSLSTEGLTDADLGWHLLHYVSAWSLPFQLVEDLARDLPDGRAGWTILMDIDRCPTWALGWLAQFRGVRLLPMEDFETPETYDLAMRDRIRRTDGQNRGGPDALAAAVQRYLDPLVAVEDRYVVIRERAGGDAYLLKVVTLSSQTPDPAAVERAVLEQKPAGVVLEYSTTSVGTYDLVRAAFGSYAEVTARFATYDQMRTQLP